MGFEHAWTAAVEPRHLFEIHRDQLERFGPALRGVAAVRRLAARQEGARLYLKHRWTGDRTVLPGLLRASPPGMFAWEDDSVWDAETLRGRWTIQAPALGSMVRIEGSHQFVERELGCEVHIEGEVVTRLVPALGGAFANRFVQDLLFGIMRDASPLLVGLARETYNEKSPAPE